MKISILLPYKENFAREYAGAVSIFINSINLKSIYKNEITVYGNTKYKEILSKNYCNLSLKNKSIIQSNSDFYVNSFIKKKSVINSEIIEIHNRPNYIKKILLLKKIKKILYFHNNPLEMKGSSTINERLFLIKNLDKIIFNSLWTKNQFLNGLPPFYKKIEKLSVIYQSTKKNKIDFKKKEKIITFVGKLNTAKGYDLFGKACIKILKKFSDWRVEVVGDESREKINFNHPRFNLNGFQSHDFVQNLYKKTSIAVICSRWEEPFGRTSLEAASNGCAIIISNRGGLPESTQDALILRELNEFKLFSLIKQLIIDNKQRRLLQKNSLKNFYLTDSYISKKIDNIRLCFKKKKITKKKNLKILHITNFNERHNGRLFFNTGRRINNGFVRLNHSVLTISDRDIQSYHRSLKDLDGSQKLNTKLIETVANYVPDIIVLGHADLINIKTLKFIKENYPNTKIIQWFLDKMTEEWGRNKSRFLDKINLMDCNFCTTSPEILSFPKKNRVYYIPNPSDISFETLKCYNNKNPLYDLFFAMSHGVHRGILKKGKYDKRLSFIEKLIQKNQNLKFNIHGAYNKQPIWSDDFKNSLYKTKMALNLSQGNTIKYYSSDRITQLIGNGILTFVDIKTKLNKFFTNKEVIFYKSVDDLSRKMNFYAKNHKIRNKIARNGKTKYHKNFDSKIVAQYMINKTMGYKSKQKFIWDDYI
jgi:glycosyltransferase involved in cell wall biosynthesis